LVTLRATHEQLVADDDERVKVATDAAENARQEKMDVMRQLDEKCRWCAISVEWQWESDSINTCA